MTEMKIIFLTREARNVGTSVALGIAVAEGSILVILSNIHYRRKLNKNIVLMSSTTNSSDIATYFVMQVITNRAIGLPWILKFS